MTQISDKLICRACLKEPDEFCSIFDVRLVGDEQFLISEMIYTCTNVEIKETDNITRYICDECVILLVQCYTFRNRCQESDVYLHIKAEQNEEINENYTEVDDFKNESETEEKPKISLHVDKLVVEDPMHDQSQIDEKPVSIIDMDYKDDFQSDDHDISVHDGETDEEDPIEPEIPAMVVVKTKTRRRGRRKVNYICEICDLKFDNADKRRYHMAKHNESYDHLCNVCGEKFKIKRAYTDHMNRHQPNFRCDLCEKAFPNNFQLKLHLRTHTGEKPHVCEVCGLAYKQNSDLKIHMRRHTGEKPIKCRFCDKTFISASYRAKHEVYHQDPSIRPFRCNICYKDFRLKKYHRQHVKTHNKNET